MKDLDKISRNLSQRRSGSTSVIQLIDISCLFELSSLFEPS